MYLSKANTWWLEASHEMDESSNMFHVDLFAKEKTRRPGQAHHWYFRVGVMEDGEI